MKRFPLWLVILILTFGVGLASVILWLHYKSLTMTYEEAISAGVPSVEYCDLINNPFKYDGQVVRVNANLYWFMHGYYLADANCRGEGDSASTAVLFYEKNREDLFNYLKTFDEPGKRREPIKIVAVGRFKYDLLSTGSSDSIEDRTSLHFELYRIESATKLYPE